MVQVWRRTVLGCDFEDEERGTTLTFSTLTRLIRDIGATRPGEGRIKLMHDFAMMARQHALDQYGTAGSVTLYVIKKNGRDRVRASMTHGDTEVAYFDEDGEVHDIREPCYV